MDNKRHLSTASGSQPKVLGTVIQPANLTSELYYARVQQRRVLGSHTICQRTIRNHKDRQYDPRCERLLVFVMSCIYPSSHASPQSGTTSNGCIPFHRALSPSRNKPVAASYNSSDQHGALETGISAGTTAINASHVFVVCNSRIN